MVELAASVAMIASCILLSRFFRGGVMSQSFAFFSVASVLFLIDRTITTSISLNYIPEDPYGLVHYIIETVFVILLTVGFLLLYRNWTRVQKRSQKVSKEPVTI